MNEIDVDNNGTYCPRLWSEAFIDERGRVYACCHFKPEELGNICLDHLKVIYNNKKIKDLRRKSLEGRLSCYHTCSLLKKDFSLEKKKKIQIEYSEMKRLKIMFGEACNINCIMCPQDSRSSLILDFDTLKKNLDLEPFVSIEIQGGEPLFIPSAMAFFDYAASNNKKVSFLTNGLIITEEWAEKIARHSNFVYFSLNAATKTTHELVNSGSKWERVLEGIRMVREARDRLGANLKIWGHMTIVPENLEEIDLFIRRFSEFGFDCIDFGYDSSVPTYLRRHFVRKHLLRKRIQKALTASSLRPSIEDLRLQNLRLV